MTAEPNKISPSGEMSLRTAVSTTVFLFLVDTFVLASPTLALFTVAVLILWMIPKALVALRKKDVFRIRASHVAVYLIMVTASVSAFAANNHLAERRAEALIEQVNAFKDKHHRYPRMLNDMVPEYFNVVPRAKITLLFGTFRYFDLRGRPTLMYYGWAPFERRYYHFESQKWHTID